MTDPARHGGRGEWALTAPAGGGQWISRKVDREVTSRPIG